MRIVTATAVALALVGAAAPAATAHQPATDGIWRTDGPAGGPSRRMPGGSC